MAMILVGAMVVAGIETVWSGRVAPPPRNARDSGLRQPAAAVELAKGEEMGRFVLGSTVILLFPEGSMAWDERYVAGAATRMGETLGLSTGRANGFRSGLVKAGHNVPVAGQPALADRAGLQLAASIAQPGSC